MKTILHTAEQQKKFAKKVLNATFTHPVVVETKPYKSTRSLEQNAKMWAMLQEVSAQVVLTEDGYKHVTEAKGWKRKLSPDDWKDVLTASLQRQDTVPGVDQGFVLLGSHTSKMTVQEMMDLITLIEAFGAEKGVKFKEDI